jgi:isocitrate dehydrogenase (NAD+)
MGDSAAVFEAVHGTAPDIAGKNLANPTALLMSAIMMLRHIGETARADAVRGALDAVLTAGKIRTRDLGGSSTTMEFADAICRHIEHAGPAPAQPA